MLAMFKRSKLYSNTNDNIEPSRFIEVKEDINDIANSQLLFYLDQEQLRYNYRIDRFEYRIDLIAEDIYHDQKYSWILLYINRITIDDLIRGRIIKYIPLDRLTKIIASI